jgi:formate dehydrogenase subunit gamma
MLDSASTIARVEDILARHQGMEGALLPILHAIQAEFGHVPQDVLPVVAKAMNISRAEVHGVMSFYHDFREVPAGRHVVKPLEPTVWPPMRRRCWGLTGTRPAVMAP